MGAMARTESERTSLPRLIRTGDRANAAAPNDAEVPWHTKGERVEEPFKTAHGACT